jgi:hypothetical protein
MTKQQAITEYRVALARQATLPIEQRWTMGAEIKALKAQALAEIEYAKLNLR